MSVYFRSDSKPGPKDGGGRESKLSSIDVPCSRIHPLTDQTHSPHWLRHPRCPGARHSTRGGNGHQAEVAATVTQQPQKSLLPTDVVAPSPPGRALRCARSHFCTPPLRTSYSVSDTSHSSPQSHLPIHTLAPARSL